MPYTVLRPLYEKLAEKLGDRDSAEQFVTSIEEAVQEMDRTVRHETIDRVGLMKVEVKDDLSKTLVTRELFEERFRHIDFKHNLLIGILIFGFTLFNPGFLALVKSLLK